MKFGESRCQAILKTLKGLNKIVTYFLFNPFRVTTRIFTVSHRFHRGLFMLNPFRIINLTLKSDYFHGQFLFYKVTVIHFFKIKKPYING